MRSFFLLFVGLLREKSHLFLALRKSIAIVYSNVTELYSLVNTHAGGYKENKTATGIVSNKPSSFLNYNPQPRHSGMPQPTSLYEGAIHEVTRVFDIALIIRVLPVTELVSVPT